MSTPPEEPELKKPPVNEIARIVNSHFLQTPYEGKDWDSVRKDIIEELETHYNKKIVEARQEQAEYDDRIWSEREVEAAIKELKNIPRSRSKAAYIENRLAELSQIEGASE